MELRDQRLFIESTKERAEQLIRTQVWGGIDCARLTEWFRQFDKVDCALLAACLLDNLTYRSKDQLLALFKAAITSDRLLPEDATSDLALIDALQKHSDPGIRLVPVISLDMPPTKSGPYMLRLFARHIGIRDKWMIWPDQLPDVPDRVHSIFVIDDFCGSGIQFNKRFLSTLPVTTFRSARPDCRIVYLPAAAHADGIKSLNQTDSTLEIVAGEILTSDHNFFEGSALDQYQNPDLKTELLNQHARMTDTLPFGGSVGKLGFASQALTYAFAHGTPNNSLPILWNELDGWTSILDR